MHRLAADNIIIYQPHAMALALILAAGVRVDSMVPIAELCPTAILVGPSSSGVAHFAVDQQVLMGDLTDLD